MAASLVALRVCQHFSDALRAALLLPEPASSSVMLGSPTSTPFNLLPTAHSAASAGSQADPWWAVKLTSKKTVLAVSIQTTSECACAADLSGARIMVGNEPWTSAASAANYVGCATITNGIVRGQRKTFACKLRGGVAPSGRYIAIWRPSASKKTLTLCEVDAVFAPDVAPRAVKRAGLLRRLSAAGLAGQQPQ